MYIIGVILAITNLGVCFALTFRMLKQKRLVAAVWLLISYFSFDYVLVSISGAFSHVQNYSGHTVEVSQWMINQGLFFVFLYNVIFIIFGEFLSRKFGIKSTKTLWILPRNLPIPFQHLKHVFLGIFIIATPFTISMYHGALYEDYVEQNESAWASVFYQCALPIISIFCFQKKYRWALILSLPSAFLAYQMGVRSFLLPTLIAAGFIYIFQSVGFNRGIGSLFKNRKMIYSTCLVSSALVVISFVTMSNKSSEQDFEFKLPDYGMAKQSLIILTIANDRSEQLGADSIILYTRNWLNPFMRISPIKAKEIVDPPVKMAYLWEGIKPSSHKTIMHYPSMIYADSYLASGFYGILYAFLWCFMCYGMEAVMARNSYILSVCLPFYMWHSYMLIRGAIAIAAVPFSYAFYFTAALSIFFCGKRIFR